MNKWLSKRKVDNQVRGDLFSPFFIFIFDEEFNQTNFKGNF